MIEKIKALLAFFHSREIYVIQHKGLRISSKDFRIPNSHFYRVEKNKNRQKIDYKTIEKESQIDDTKSD